MTAPKNDPLYDLLLLCDDEFVPPLSSRHSTTQKTLADAPATGDVSTYYNELAKQEQVRIHSQGTLVGFASYFHKEDEDGTSVAYLTTIITHPEYRGRGFSKKLYNGLFALLEEDVIELRTWSTNEAHLRVLGKMGFVETLRIVDDRGEGIDTVYFRKKLQ